jgi:hypothetical protein
VTGRVNERSTAYLSVSFLNKSGALESPASAAYTVHEKETGEELVGETEITPIAALVEIKLGADANTIIHTARESEMHVVTVTATYGENDELNSAYTYWVTNLRFLTPPAE